MANNVSDVSFYIEVTVIFIITLRSENNEKTFCAITISDCEIETTIMFFELLFHKLFIAVKYMLRFHLCGKCHHGVIQYRA